jgi:hypothetical protein
MTSIDEKYRRRPHEDTVVEWDDLILKPALAGLTYIVMERQIGQRARIPPLSATDTALDPNTWWL